MNVVISGCRTTGRTRLCYLVMQLVEPCVYFGTRSLTSLAKGLLYAGPCNLAVVDHPYLSPGQAFAHLADANRIVLATMGSEMDLSRTSEADIALSTEFGGTGFRVLVRKCRPSIEVPSYAISPEMAAKLIVQAFNEGSALRTATPSYPGRVK